MKFLTVALLGLAAVAAERPALDGAAAFSRLKSLAGEWQADSPMGKVRTTYEVIAGGTAVVERERGEHMPEMLTVYHMDGKRLLLTHYCMAGNQPRMEARSYDAGSGEIRFAFDGGTNLTPAAGHMHNATFRLTDDDHFTSNWEFYENGRRKNEEKFEYTRVR
jgi:hypothetical protein